MTTTHSARRSAALSTAESSNMRTIAFSIALVACTSPPPRPMSAEEKTAAEYTALSLGIDRYRRNGGSCGEVVAQRLVARAIPFTNPPPAAEYREGQRLRGCNLLRGALTLLPRDHWTAAAIAAFRSCDDSTFLNPPAAGTH